MQIVSATRADHRALIHTLANAFANDPVINWVVRSDRKRREGFERFFATVLDLYQPLGHVYCRGDRQGAALWAPPGRWQVGFLRSLALLPAMAAIAGLKRVFLCAGALEAIERHHPREPHLYLHYLGVEPELQSNGHGGALLRHGLELAGGDGLPVYLETGNERTLGFYARHGFEVKKEISIGPGAPPLWLMWREARCRRSTVNQ